LNVGKLSLLLLQGLIHPLLLLRGATRPNKDGANDDRNDPDEEE
jgi:hypothetical protein